MGTEYNSPILYSRGSNKYRKYTDPTHQVGKETWGLCMGMHGYRDLQGLQLGGRNVRCETLIIQKNVLTMIRIW